LSCFPDTNVRTLRRALVTITKSGAADAVHQL
jgi:hypothetical protein